MQMTRFKFMQQPTSDCNWTEMSELRQAEGNEAVDQWFRSILIFNREMKTVRGNISSKGYQRLRLS